MNESAPKGAPERSFGGDLHSVSDCTDKHGAEIAADARPMLALYIAEQRIIARVSAGLETSADDLEDSPDALGAGLGGVFMRLHRAGVIRRVGWKASSRKSRAGGVIAVWVAGPALDGDS